MHMKAMPPRRRFGCDDHRHFPSFRPDALPDPQAIWFWIGRDVHLLHCAIGSDGGHVNVFAMAAFADWHPAVRQMVAAGDVERRWGLSDATHHCAMHRFPERYG